MIYSSSWTASSRIRAVVLFGTRTVASPVPRHRCGSILFISHSGSAFQSFSRHLSLHQSRAHALYCAKGIESSKSFAGKYLLSYFSDSTPGRALAGLENQGNYLLHLCMTHELLTYLNNVITRDVSPVVTLPTWLSMMMVLELK